MPGERSVTVSAWSLRPVGEAIQRWRRGVVQAALILVLAVLPALHVQAQSDRSAPLIVADLSLLEDGPDVAAKRDYASDGGPVLLKQPVRPDPMQAYFQTASYAEAPARARQLPTLPHVRPAEQIARLSSYRALQRPRTQASTASSWEGVFDERIVPVQVDREAPSEIVAALAAEVLTQVSDKTSSEPVATLHLASGAADGAHVAGGRVYGAPETLAQPVTVAGSGRVEEGWFDDPALVQPVRTLGDTPGFQAVEDARTGELSGAVFLDIDSDGEAGSGEVRLEGQIVHLFGLDGGHLLSRTSAAFGQFGFEDLEPGRYQLVTQIGWEEVAVLVDVRAGRADQPVAIPLPAEFLQIDNRTQRAESVRPPPAAP